MSRFGSQQTDSDFLTDVFKIALGVFIGGLLAALAYTKYMAWEVEYSLRQATAELQKQAKQQAEQDRQRREAVASERAAREGQRAAEEQQRKQQEADMRVQRVQHEADMRAAWKQIYRPSPACQADQMTLTCANAHAAAHKRFMEIYGEMPPRF